VRESRNIARFNVLLLSLLIPFALFAAYLLYLRVVPYARSERAKANEHGRLERLFDEASGAHPSFRSSESSEDAVREIGATPGEEAEGMLLQLATHEPDLQVANVQVQAVRELQARNDPKSAAALAGIMKTQTLIDTREAVAQSFQSIPCDHGCAVALLLYLKKVDQGELNVEDRDFNSSSSHSSLDDYVKEKIGVEQREIYSLIYKALLRQSTTTNAVLADNYGLGTSDPEDFAISFVMRSEDRQSCSLLESSLKGQRHDTKPPPSDLRKKLEMAVSALRCDDSTSVPHP